MLWIRHMVLCAFTASFGVGTCNVLYLKRQTEGQSFESTISSLIKTSGSAINSIATPTPTPTTTIPDYESEMATETFDVPEASGSLPPKDQDVPVCHAATDASVKPFCLPKDEQPVYVDNTYDVTWDSDIFSPNSTITVGINYLNVSSDNHGKSAYTSLRTPNQYGYVPITMKKAWLQGETSNNLTIFLVQYDEVMNERISTHKGPKVSLTTEIPKHHPPPPPTPAPNELGLKVGLPVTLGAVFVVAIGLCVGMRKHRRIGLGNIMGSRNKGYGTGKSRAERLGVGRRARGGAIRLEDMEDNETARYSDNPAPNPKARIIASDAEIFNEVQRREGNIFRQEISRLKNWQ
ncbi:hypothetical protein FQN57_000735 [Myotisia sp. PD_48]|nr:hypothetical protein FQN57_000735 [Myotisia sp. PD_48]